MVREWENDREGYGAYPVPYHRQDMYHNSPADALKENFMLFSFRQPYSGGLKIFAALNILWSGFWILAVTAFSISDVTTGRETLGFMIGFWIFAVLIFAGPPTFIQYMWQRRIKDRELMKLMNSMARRMNPYSPYPEPEFNPYGTFPSTHPRVLPPAYPPAPYPPYSEPSAQIPASFPPPPPEPFYYPPPNSPPPPPSSYPPATLSDPSYGPEIAEAVEMESPPPIPAPPKKELNERIDDQVDLDEETLARARELEREERFDEAMALYDEVGEWEAVDRLMRRSIENK